MNISKATHEDVAKALHARSIGMENPLLAALYEEASIAAAEHGADREGGYDPELWTDEWIEKWLEEHKEPKGNLVSRVLRHVFDNTESFDEQSIGTELSYLVMAITNDSPHQPNTVLWDVGPGNERYRPIYNLFVNLFQEHDPVWGYIQIMRKFTGTCDPPLNCTHEEFVAFANSLQPGDRVIELGQCCMTGETGTVLETPTGKSVKWDTVFTEGSGMVTSITGGTRRLPKSGVGDEVVGGMANHIRSLEKALEDARELLCDIMNDRVNHQDEAEKWLREYAPEKLFHGD